MGNSYTIVVLQGDGIGPEIVDATLEVLETLQALYGRFSLTYEFHDAGAGCYRQTGEPIGPQALEAFARADATLKGPVGLPGVRKPDGTEAGLLGGVLRIGFDLYANVRPMRLFPNVASPLAGRSAGDIDYVIIRENSEGLYLSRGVGLVTPDAASDSLLMTRRGCRRISRCAFQKAMEKERGAPEDGRKRVTLVDKSNVLRSFAFFRKIFFEEAEAYPDVDAECLYMDAAAAALVNRPEHFQVLVTENMFGDILSDLGGATVGGLGMCPSGNIGERLAYFEPIHGSAPDIAGRCLANPTSQLLAAAMMLTYLGETAAGEILETSIWQLYAERRIPLRRGGGVEGGSAFFARELKKELGARSGRLRDNHNPSGERKRE